MTEISTPPSESKDVQDNKVFAILAYLNILFLVPLLAAKESPFARYHANQGIILFIASIALYIVATILSVALAFVSLHLVPILWYLLYLIVTVFIVLGIINAAQGKQKELPLIGKFQILK